MKKLREIEKFVDSLNDIIIAENQLFTLAVHPDDVFGGSTNTKNCTNESNSCSQSTNSGICTNKSQNGCIYSINENKCTNEIKEAVACL